MNACSSFCLPWGYPYRKCAVRDFDTQYDEKMLEKKIRRYISSHSHGGITKVQITATATQAILWFSMLLLLEFKSLVEQRSKTFQMAGAVAHHLEVFKLTWFCLGSPISLVMLGMFSLQGRISWSPVWHCIALIQQPVSLAVGAAVWSIGPT